jgi:hypothetical protein
MTFEHLVRHYPRTYLDARQFVTVRELSADRVLTVLGRVTSAAAHRTRGGRTDFTARVSDSTGAVTCHFFGQPWLARAISPGASVVVSGTLDPLGRMLNPMFEVVETEIEDLLHAGRLVPIHALTRGVTGRGMRVAVRRALDLVADRVVDPIPADASRGLESLAAALRHIHFPMTGRANRAHSGSRSRSCSCSRPCSRCAVGSSPRRGAGSQPRGQESWRRPCVTPCLSRSPRIRIVRSVRSSPISRDRDPCTGCWWEMSEAARPWSPCWPRCT